MKKWISPGGEGGRCVGLTTLPSSRDDCLNILGAQACNRIALHSTVSSEYDIPFSLDENGGKTVQITGAR
jgi:hypothetical protein